MTPDRDYSESIEKKFRALELRIEQDVVRRLRKAKEITSTADWQLNRYYVLGNSTADIEKIFKETVGDTYPEVFELYDKVLAQQYVRTTALYEQINEEATPYDQNPEMRQLVDGLIRTSNNQLQNITGSMGFMLDYGNGKMVFSPFAEVYDRYLDQAMVEITSGTFDYNSVLRRVTRQLTNSGLRVIDYASGHTNRCDVAVRRAIMTGIAQLTSSITQQNAAKLGTRYYEVTWHAGARPEHMVWQGKVYSEDDLRRVCGLGDPLGLCGINCYHMYYPFVPGVSERNYSDEWLAEMNAKEMMPVSYRGKEYTRYEAEQRQRYLETSIRAQRERVTLLKEGGADHDDIVIQQCRYQAMLDEYRKFSKAMNLPTQMERVYTGRTTGRVAPTPTQMGRYTPEMRQNATIDSKMYYRRKDILGDRMVSLAAFRQMKYNDVEQFEAIERQYDTIKAINKKPWTRAFKQNARDTYYEFLDGGVELNAHSVARYLDRRRKTEKYDLTAVKTQIARGANYKQVDGRDVFFYDGVAIIREPKTNVITTFVIKASANSKVKKGEWIPQQEP